MATPVVHAYILAADPWWLEESVRAYYPLVDRIVVSYDVNGRSWTGTALPVDDCLARVRELDVEGKCEYAPGDFSRTDRHPLDNDTHQRQHALNDASNGADWVLQLDTDEVIPDLAVFEDCLREADRRGAGGLEFPARWLLTRTRSGRFVEGSSRFWRPRATYPGPVAVRAGSKLVHCRQADVSLFRVDMAARGTDPAQSRETPIHRVISTEDAILHYSKVRDEASMLQKAGWSGHTDLYSEPAELRRWRRLTRHPGLGLLRTPVTRRADRVRLVSLSRDRRFWSGETDGTRR